jgi:hypothetical protein
VPASRPLHSRRPRRRLAAVLAVLVLLASVLSTAAASVDAWAAAGEGIGADPLAAADEAHLVVSEVQTGGAGASDEFIEIYNPSPFALPLEGLEVVYVSATGLSVTRKAAWEAGHPPLNPGAHLLMANEAGIFASLADVPYANGLAASGGSVAIRITGASTAVDAVGWGSAASTWLEGTPVEAAPAGSSLERLPGGASGSGQDMDDNVVDFVVRDLPDPQNLGSPPIPVATAAPSPSGTVDPSVPSVTPSPSAPPTSTTPSPTASPSATPAPVAPISVAEARAMPNGSPVVVEAVSLTDGGFSEGGGYVADSSGGIAVLVADGTFPRAALLRVSGTVDDRFHQRTVRAEAAGVEVLGTASEPDAPAVATGSVGEAVEGQLAQILGTILGAPTSLSAGLAFDVDDGSGSLRVVVGSDTGIDTAEWETGSSLTIRGVIGQRDSSGSGTAGYRLQPRDSADVTVVGATPEPTESAPPSGGSPPGSPSHPADPGVISIAAARAAPSGSRLTVTGVVTLPTGLSEPGSGVIQDSSGAILLRVSDEAGDVLRGQLVRVSGVRSTWSGMLSLRVSDSPTVLGSQADPVATRRSTGAIGEAEEGLLIVTRGLVTAAPRRTSAENAYLDLDDGSGPLRVFLSPRSGIAPDALLAGAWLEVTGVLTQETSGKQPERGYRLWPRNAADVRVVASPVGDVASGAGIADGAGGRAPSGGPRSGPPAPNAGRGVDVAFPPKPRLALALPTASPPGAVPGADSSPVVGLEANEEVQALLLLAAAFALLAAASMVIMPDLVPRVRTLLPRGKPMTTEAGGYAGQASSSGIGAETGGLAVLTVLDGFGPSGGGGRDRPPPSVR